MKKVAAAIIENPEGQLLFYLRDDKPSIPFPNHWDFFGGHVEDGESFDMALVREIKEEIGVTITDYEFWKEFECLEGDAWPNVKRIYRTFLDVPAEELVLTEGQRLAWVSRKEAKNLKWANILGRIVDEYLEEFP